MTSGYKEINGLKMYYEIHGEGTPLLMLHGQFATIEMFASILDVFTKDHQVILVEQQGHGRTADIERPFSFHQMAKDTAALLAELNVSKVDVLGYSAGGSVALQLALHFPNLVNKLILASTVYDENGYYPQIKEAIKNPSPDGFPPEMRADYEKVAPRPENWPQLIYKSADMANSTEPNDKIQLDQLKAIVTPTLVVVGDQDIIIPEYAKEMAEVLGTELVTIPGDHASYITSDIKPLTSKLLDFINS